MAEPAITRATLPLPDTDRAAIQRRFNELEDVLLKILDILDRQTTLVEKLVTVVGRQNGATSL